MKKTMLLLCLSLFAGGPALAHVTNEETAYSDIALSEAAADILLLDVLGIISAADGSQDFRPQEPLLTTEFADWMDHYPSEWNPVEQGAGEQVSYRDVNEVLFDGQLEPEAPEEAMTREAFAIFVAGHAETAVDGETLLSRAGFTPGPAGEITAVEPNADGYQVMVGGKGYALGTHPRIHSGIADPAVWKGMSLAESWVGPDSSDGYTGESKEKQEQAIQYAVVEPQIAEAPVAETKPEVAKADMDEEAGRINWGTGIIVLCVAFLVYLIYRRKRQVN